MEFQIRKASPEDWEQVCSLIRSVWEQMENRDWFADGDTDYTKNVLESGNADAYLAVETGSKTVAAVFTVVFPGPGEEHLGRDAGLRESQLQTAAHMDAAAVLPAFRGYGLQRRLMEAAEEDLRAQGFRCLLCTVHPDNRFSLENVKRQGYELMTVTKKYGGLTRAVLMKRLSDV